MSAFFHLVHESFATVLYSNMEHNNEPITGVERRMQNFPFQRSRQEIGAHRIYRAENTFT